MQAVVPAAGEGTRMRPLTADRPKGLVAVGDRPLLAHVFDALLKLEIDRTVVVVGYRGERIVDHFGARYRDMALEYVTQPEPRGLADAVWQAREGIDGAFVVLNGDNVFLDSIEPVLADPAADGALLVEDGAPEAVARGAEVRTDGDLVTRVIEKPDAPTGRLMITGCYRLPPAAIDACGAVAPSPRGELELADAINDLVDRGFRFVPVEYEGWRRNVNTPEDRAVVERKLG